LQGHHLHPRDGDVTEQGTRRHVAHGEEDRVLEAIVAEQILIQEKHANVGGVPRRHQPYSEEPVRTLHSVDAFDLIFRALRFQREVNGDLGIEEGFSFKW